MEEKIPLLVGLLRETEAHRTMVFVNTRRMAERLEASLRANGFHAQALSGDVPQKKRLQFLRQFHEGELAVLIATDVASRGLHIPDVSHIFNFDLPQDAPDYVHRIGRTARAGAEGDAISFGCEEYAISSAGHRALHRPQDPGRGGGTRIAGQTRSAPPTDESVQRAAFGARAVAPAAVVAAMAAVARVVAAIAAAVPRWQPGRSRRGSQPRLSHGRCGSRVRITAARQPRRPPEIPVAHARRPELSGRRTA